LILGLSLQHITGLERHVKRLDTAIAERMAALPHTLDTIPGFGPVFSGGILSEIGDITRFHGEAAKVAKFAGFKWRQHQSAAFQAEDTPLTRTGNRFLRYYFCEAANAVRMRDPQYTAYYDRKYHEVRTHRHKRALVLTARKLVRLVVRLLTTNQPYQPRKEGSGSNNTQK
jgi:transposase